jgi:hypothetical protein
MTDNESPLQSESAEELIDLDPSSETKRAEADAELEN